MSPALLPLFVALPLLAGSISVALPWRTARRLLYVAVPLVTLVGGVALMAHHLHEPAQATQLGSYAGGVAIPFVSDMFSALMLTATSGVTLAATAYAILTGEDSRSRFLPALAMVLTGGVNGALLTADLFNLFVFIEVMLMPSYALIALTGTWRRLGIGRTFVLVNLLTSTLLLVGVGFVYGTAGTVNLASLAGAGRADARVAAATGLVLLALAVKAGVVPVHSWLPRAYPATSPAIMALFSGLHTKVAIYGLFRVATVLFGGDAAAGHPLIPILLCVTMIVGAFASLGERTMREVLAYQMVNGVGFILIAFALVPAGGSGVAPFSAGIFYLVHHMVTMAALITGVGAAESTYGTGRLDRIGGLAKRERTLAWVVALASLSLVGFPPLSGFLAKVGVVLAAAGMGGAVGWSVIAVVVVASLGALVSMMRLWRDMFWDNPMKRYRPDPRGGWAPLPDDVRVPAAWLAPSMVLVAASIAMVVLAGIVMAWTTRSAEALVDVDGYVRAVLGR